MQDISTILKFKPGDKIPISRKTLIGFMEKSHGDINGDNIKKWLEESLNKCGINPWGDDERFHQHIYHLNESGMYKVTTDTHA